MPSQYTGVDGKLVVLDSGELELHFEGWSATSYKKKASPVRIPRDAVVKAEVVVQKKLLKDSYLRLHVADAEPTSDYSPDEDPHTLIIYDEHADRFSRLVHQLNGTVPPVHLVDLDPGDERCYEYEHDEEPDFGGEYEDDEEPECEDEDEDDDFGD